VSLRGMCRYARAARQPSGCLRADDLGDSERMGETTAA
jgi:hypothetical protein